MKNSAVLLFLHRISPKWRKITVLWHQKHWSYNLRESAWWQMITLVESGRAKHMRRRIKTLNCSQVRFYCMCHLTSSCFRLSFWLYLNQSVRVGSREWTSHFSILSPVPLKTHFSTVPQNKVDTFYWTNRLQEMEKKGHRCDSSIFVWLWQPSPVRAFCDCKAGFMYRSLWVKCVLLQGARRKQSLASFSSERPQQVPECGNLQSNLNIYAKSEKELSNSSLLGSLLILLSYLIFSEVLCIIL